MRERELKSTTKTHNRLICSKGLWRGRECYRLGNGLLELVVLTGGGHIAELRFTRSPRRPSLNPLWVPPWKTIEPYDYDAQAHTARFGTVTEGRLLSGISGQNLCLDYFGSPSPEEAKQGMSQHGEAPSLRWRVIGRSIEPPAAVVSLGVRLPIAGLQFERTIRLYDGASAVWFQETVSNERKCDHIFHWTEHVTLGPPFLSGRETVVALPGTRGMTFPTDYDERRSLLAPGKAFRWPLAPKISGGRADLRRVLHEKGRGFVAGVLMDRRREWSYVAAQNRRHALLLIYCFRTNDFPWVAIWEENRAIRAVPWRGRTETRGLEFGTTPLPVMRRESFRTGTLFGTPTLAVVPARGRKVVEYAALLADSPPGFTQIDDVRFEPGEMVIAGGPTKFRLVVPRPPRDERDSLISPPTGHNLKRPE
jgi:hypothetical protein